MGRRDLEELIEAYVLDLLDEDVAATYETELGAHPDLAVQVAELREVLVGLCYEDRATAPPLLRDGVLTQALQRRPPGVDEGLQGRASAASCHRATVELVSSVVDDLDAGDMAARTVYHIPVVELIRHLSGMEEQLAQVLSSGGRSTAGTRGMTPEGHREVRDDSDAGNPDEVVAAWHHRSGALVAELSASPIDDGAYQFAWGTLRATQLLIIRAFELWTHAEDICRATGRPLRVPPPDVLHTMAGTALDILLPVVGSRSVGGGETVRVTLTGDGGGSWLHRLGATGGRSGSGHDPFGSADATVVADIVDFCRLVGDRADADGIPAHRHGDPALCEHILHTAPLLADYGAGPLAR
jgi:uncharacterized protein (TIGR03083 family)